MDPVCRFVFRRDSCDWFRLSVFCLLACSRTRARLSRVRSEYYMIVYMPCWHCWLLLSPSALRASPSITASSHPRRHARQSPLTRMCLHMRWDLSSHSSQPEHHTTRPAPCAPCLTKEAQGSTSTPHMRGACMGAHGMPYKLTLGIPQVPTVPRRSSRNDSTAATDNTLNTPMRPYPSAPRLPREALGSLATPHMRGARMGAHGRP